MRRQLLFLFSIILLVAIAINCGTSSKLYRYDNKKRTYTGQLNDSISNTLKKFLTSFTNSKLNDTIIIKYDFNRETCWSILDQNNDEYIMSFVTRRKQRVQQVSTARPNVSVFNFREPGNDLNKIIKWDSSIIIDSSKQLFNLLFKERCTCGSSIIILPDKKFVFLRSDSHSEILDLTQKQIEEALNKK